MIGAELEQLLRRIAREELARVLGATVDEIEDLGESELRERAQSRIAAMRARATKAGAR